MNTTPRFTLTELLAVIAIVRGERDELARILRAYPPLIHATNDQGKTLLHFAAANGQVSLVSYLIGQGADPSLTDKEGNTAADAAAQEGHAHLAESLTQIMQDAIDGPFSSEPFEWCE